VGPVSLVRTTEDLLGRKNSGSGQEILEYCRGDSSRLPRGTLYPQKLALTSPTRSGRSFGIVRSRTQTTEFLVPLYFKSEFRANWATMPVIKRRWWRNVVRSARAIRRAEVLRESNLTFRIVRVRWYGMSEDDKMQHKIDFKSRRRRGWK
jgi:hypothetical protein